MLKIYKDLIHSGIICLIVFLICHWINQNSLLLISNATLFPFDWISEIKHNPSFQTLISYSYTTFISDLYDIILITGFKLLGLSPANIINGLSLFSILALFLCYFRFFSKAWMAIGILLIFFISLYLSSSDLIIKSLRSQWGFTEIVCSIVIFRVYHFTFSINRRIALIILSFLLASFHFSYVGYLLIPLLTTRFAKWMTSILKKDSSSHYMIECIIIIIAIIIAYLFYKNAPIHLRDFENKTNIIGLFSSILTYSKFQLNSIDRTLIFLLPLILSLTHITISFYKCVIHRILLTDREQFILFLSIQCLMGFAVVLFSVHNAGEYRLPFDRFLISCFVSLSPILIYCFVQIFYKLNFRKKGTQVNFNQLLLISIGIFVYFTINNKYWLNKKLYGSEVFNLLANKDVLAPATLCRNFEYLGNDQNTYLKPIEDNPNFGRYLNLHNYLINLDRFLIKESGEHTNFQYILFTNVDSSKLSSLQILINKKIGTYESIRSFNDGIVLIKFDSNTLNKYVSKQYNYLRTINYNKLRRKNSIFLKYYNGYNYEL